MPITDSSNTQLVCKFFSTENVPAELLRYLYIVGKKYPNDIFETCWQQQSKSCANLHTFQAVYEMVCIPVLTECQEILVSLEQGTMTLENVEMYFWRFESNKLKNNLQHLCQGIKECFPSNKQLLPPRNWVSTVATNIQKYKKRSSYVAAAKIVLMLKDSMKLTGDFTAVNTIVQQVAKDNVDSWGFESDIPLIVCIQFLILVLCNQVFCFHACSHVDWSHTLIVKRRCTLGKGQRTWFLKTPLSITCVCYLYLSVCALPFKLHS